MTDDKQINKAFKFYTNTLKAMKTDDGTRYIVGIASSTSIDRDNERMSEKALQTMKSTAEANLTLFTNHEYKVPDDIFGSCVEAKIVANKDAEPVTIKGTDGNQEITTFQPQTLEVKIKVVSDSVNPKAGQIYNAINEGVNLGLSIGGMVKSLLKVKDVVTDTMHTLIDSIDLFEISLVGIPANADAMNLAIAKSLKGIEVVEANKEELEQIMESTKTNKISMEDVKSTMVGELKKYYDEYEYPCDPCCCGSVCECPDEDKIERQDANYAKAYAENVLNRLGEKITVSESDDHVIHLNSHSSEMWMLVNLALDTKSMAKHIKQHLEFAKTMLDEMKAEEDKEEIEEENVNVMTGL